MSTVQHTPGPWCVKNDRHVVVDYRPISDTGEMVASVHCYPGSGFFASPSEAAANARLIAASPDLLAALEEAYEILRWIEDAPGAIVAQVRTAIAKATE